MPGPPETGDLAPDFELLDETGASFRLSQQRGRTVILFFYPRDNTSGCTKQACGFRDGYPKIEAHDAVIVGISPDDAGSHQKFKTQHELPYPLLVDSDHKVAEAYGAWGEKSMYGRKYEGIIRSHFVIDEAGRIVDAQVKISPAKSIERALATLENGA